MYPEIYSLFLEVEYSESKTQASKKPKQKLECREWDQECAHLQSPEFNTRKFQNFFPWYIINALVKNCSHAVPFYTIVPVWELAWLLLFQA